MVSDAVAKCVGVGEETHETPSFERVYDDYVDFVWRSARRLGVDDAGADDVVQHVFLVVHRRLPEFEGRSTMKTWLFGIVLRAVQDHRRTLRRKSPHLRASGGEPDELPADGGPEDAFERAEAVAMLDRLLDTLDEQERIVFVMAELEQMTANEIGEATGLDPKAVYSRLRAARTQFERAAQRMRTKLAAEERRA